MFKHIVSNSKWGFLGTTGSRLRFTRQWSRVTKDGSRTNPKLSHIIMHWKSRKTGTYLAQVEKESISRDNKFVWPCRLLASMDHQTNVK